MGFITWIKNIGGASKKDQLSMAQLEQLLKATLTNLQREYCDVVKVNGPGHLYFIKTGTWLVTLVDTDLYITYKLSKGILKIRITPTFSGKKLRALHFSTLKEPIRNTLKECYIKPVVDALETHFTDKVKIRY